MLISADELFEPDAARRRRTKVVLEERKVRELYEIDDNDEKYVRDEKIHRSSKVRFADTGSAVMSSGHVMATEGTETTAEDIATTGSYGMLNGDVTTERSTESHIDDGISSTDVARTNGEILQNGDVQTVDSGTTTDVQTSVF